MQKSAFEKRKPVSKILSILSIVFLLTLLIWVVSFCTKKKSGDTMIGPSYVAAPADLKIDTFIVPSRPVILSRAPAVFSGKFNHKVTWYLTLTQPNGAVKIFTGLSDNFNVSWTGNHDSTRFFVPDSVTAELSFLGSDLQESKKFRLVLTKDYTNSKTVVMFDGFESSITWPDYSFVESGEETPTARTEDTTVVIEGNKSFHMAGRDANNTYFIEGVRHQSSGQNETSFVYVQVPTYSPDSLYFNCYIYGTGNTTTRASISVSEDDNHNGVYEDGRYPSEDTYEYDVKVTWTGWKLISAKYADFMLASDPKYGGSGNRIKQVELIKEVTFNLLSDPPQNTADYYLDFPVMTAGEPFDPNQ